MARRSSADQLLEELREPLERISEGNERIIDTLNRLDSHIARGAASGDPLTRHFRRYLPFYVIALAWALMLVLLPTINERTQVTTSEGQEGGTTIDVGPGGEATVTPGSTAGGTSGASGATRTRTQTGVSAAAVQGSIDVVKSLQGQGTTRAGVKCDANTRQIPWSEYAAMCLGAYSGDNGAQTNRGVTKDTIKVVYRKYPDSANQAAVDAFLAQAGFASREVEDNTMNELIPYFNKTYETFGRKVVVETYSSASANGTEEAQGRGRDGACADAETIAGTNKAFITAFAAGSEQYADCASQRFQLGHIAAAPYYAETYYKKWQPYIWHRVMECERIATQVAEYIGKRLAHKPAKWAGDPTYQARTRKFGTYVPDNEGYQLCVRLNRKILAEQYGFDDNQLKNDTFVYTLDISRFADMAAQAVLRFQASGVTTVVLACDSISMVLLTQAAARNNYFPEWLLIGVAGTDLDQWGNLTDQNASVGHLFGMSQLGHTESIFAKDGEMNRTYKAATGKDLPTGATGRYSELVHLFNAIQMSGPNLNYSTLAKGLHGYPTSGLKVAPFGRWSWATSHTGIIDSKEVYWTAPDKDTSTSNGTYKITYNARRFTNGEWPAEDPPIYPGGKTN